MKETIEIRAELSKIENRKIKEKSVKSKVGF